MRAVLSFFAVVLGLAYPLTVYYGLTHFGTRPAACLLLGAVLTGAWLRGHKPTGKPLLPAGRARAPWAAVGLPLAIGLLLVVSALLDDRRYMLATPVLINAGLFATFFSSLAGAQPLVERFARLQVADLSPAEVAYCRTVTGSWCAFFVLNGSISALLAWAAPLSWWTLYTGLIAYLLIGLVAGTEYTLRKYRFRRYGTGLHDRFFRALFPPRSAEP